MGDIAADKQQRRVERQVQEREGEAQKQREEAMRDETIHSAEERVPEWHARTNKSDTEMDTEAEGEAGTSQSHSRHKEGHMTNIYMIDLDEEVIVDFLKHHKELYDKNNEHSKAKARKECLWEQFANSHKLSVKMCKT